MLTINQIQENKEELLRKLRIKNFKKTEIIDDVLELDKQRRDNQQKTDQLQSEMKSISKEVGSLFQAGKKEEANLAKEKTKSLKEEIKKWQSSHSNIEEKLNKLLVLIPNLPHDSVPPGLSSEDNEVVETISALPDLDEKAQPHWDLGKKYDIIDFELGTKITGAGFPVYKGKGAKLQRALINFFLDENEKAGYTEILPPLLVNEDSGFGTGQLPDKEGQ